jgi:NhaA family Na+:H+ antiporter
MSKAQLETRPLFLRVLLTPFQQFVRRETIGGLILICTAAAAFVWANLPAAADSYHHMKEYPIGVHIGSWALNQSLEWWVNDALMALFFLLVGLEIKREVLVGELAGWRRAMWPVLAAAGGMIVPAALYATVNWNGEALRGWGIPMATDIAFALGVMSLLGNRVPVSLKVFLTALAIVDDLGAVLVIAIFYTTSLHVVDFAMMAGLLGLCAAYGWTGGRRLSVYGVIGVVLWYVTYHSGVHATVAGVLLAMTIPIGPHSRSLPRPEANGAEPEFEQMEAALQAVRTELAEAQSPLHRLEHALTPWVAYLIMPVFALFNAGVTIAGGGAATISAVNVGILLGLLVGKPVGIVGASWISYRLGLISLPADVRWPAMVGAGILGGIGFTMSLFIAMLAFPSSPALLDQAKLGVLATSVIAAGVGLAVLARATGKKIGGPIEVGTPDAH